MAAPLVKLEDVAEVCGGSTPSRREPAYFGGGICWATPTDVTALNSLYIHGTKESLTQLGLDSSSAKLMPAGAVLLTSRATIGFTTVSKVPISTNQGFVNFVCGPKLVPEYLAYWLRTQKPKMLQQAGGTTFKEIGRGALRKFEIPLPSMAEQMRVVDLLTRAESVVRLRREAQQKAAELVPAIFLDMFGDPVSNPKGFSSKRLGAYLDIKSTVKLPDLIADAHLPCIGADSIESSTGKIVTWPTVGEIRPISGKYYFEPADVLYSKIRPALRKVIIAPVSGYCSADMYPLRVDSAVAVPEYVASLLLSNAFTKYAIGVSARAQMPKVNRETLFAYEHPMPPLSQQQVFAKRAQQIASIAKQQVDATSKAEATFQALLSREFEISL